MRRLWWIAAAAASAMVAQLSFGLSHGATLARDPGFQLVSPADGQTEAGAFVLAWSGGSFHRFAVTVGDPVAAPGKPVSPNGTTVVTSLTALSLNLAPRHDGSPSARAWHRVVVIPLDASGRRVGEQVLVAHVRSAG